MNVSETRFVKPAMRLLRRISKDKRGNVLAIGAASLPLLIGSAAIAVDSISLTLARRELQRAADSGALAGAHALVQEKAHDSSVDHDLTLNNRFSLSQKVVENPPTKGSYSGSTQAVRVVLASDRPAPFMSFFSSGNRTVQVEATAAIVYTGKFCMISLEEGTTAGISFGGNTTLDLGCGVSTNSKAAIAISAGGSSTIIASPVAGMGGIPQSSSYAAGTRLMPYSPKQPDPYENLPIPQVPSDCESSPLSVQPNSTVTVIPNETGVYCYKGGMDVKGTLNLAPGTYYLDGGSFNANSNANITGTGVTIILTSSTAATNPSSVASVDINGGATLNLSAPKDGTYGGVLMYQDPRAALGNTAKINGNSASSFEGGFYFPKAYMTFNGTTGMKTECLQLVARRLAFTGNSKVKNVCPEDSKSKAFDATFVRLVG